MTHSNSKQIEPLLELLLEVAAPLLSSATDNLEANSEDQTITFQQVVEQISIQSMKACGADQLSVISFNGAAYHLHSAHNLTFEQQETLSQPYFTVGDQSLQEAWQKAVRPGCWTDVLTIDSYGEIRVFLLLAWPNPKINQNQTEIVALLQRVANGALRFQRKTASSRRRARWISASRKLTDALLAGADEEEALNLVASAAQNGAGADTALIFLPSIGDEWTCEIAAGKSAQDFIGMPFPNSGIFSGAVESGLGIILRSIVHYDLGEHPTLKQFGPAVMAPLRDADSPHGALVLLRLGDREPFAPDDLPLTAAFASQTSLALEVASARHSQSLALLLEDRDRISRDLHDFAVQQLFATGMKLDFLREGSQAGTLSRSRMTEGLQEAMVSLEESVRQIRSIVHNLKEPDIQGTFTDQMETESSRARHFLSYAPSLIFELDGKIINPGTSNANIRLNQISERVDAKIADDAVAILRESLSNIARHAHARATRIEVTVAGHGSVGELIISVIDDGRGIDPGRTRSSGLANMAKRARIHGGSFAIGAGPRERGTSLVWRVPLAQ